jgi:tRNA A37 threonylcarbamoyladenosine dehydratase
MNDFDARFGGIGRLYSSAGLQRLRQAHVCVVGIGGVGSWAAEALARSGIGNITLVDLDDVCVSNINRQLPALDSVMGQPKVAVMAARIQAVNPECRVRALAEFFTETTAQEILQPKYDWVIDAIDQVANKCLLIASCRQQQIPLVCAGAAGGRRDPSAVRVADLAQTTHDALLQRVRKKLRDDFGFPREAGEHFHVPCVFSPEPAVMPAGDCDPRGGCESAYGTASFVTGTFGFLAASHVVTQIATGEPSVNQA